MNVQLSVEGAGCESCAERIRDALRPVIDVRAVTIDEARDLALVHGSVDQMPDEKRIAKLLDDASAGTGHAYRLSADSLTAR